MDILKSHDKGPGKRGQIVADTLLPTQMFPRLPACKICCRHKFCVWDTKNVSDFVQKHFVSATNVSQFAQPKKYHEQQCVRNNVSSFTRALKSSSDNYRKSSVECLAIGFCLCIAITFITI